MTDPKAANSNEAVLKTAENILAKEPQDIRSILYKNILLNAVTCQDDTLDILDLKIIDRMVAEFRHAACIFKPYRSKRKVSIFGSARVAPGSPYYQLAVKFGREAAEKGFMVITGAAEGIMRAGIEGAGTENSFGVNILLPVEQAAARIMQDDPKLVTFKYFFTRKLFFVMEADAIALFPGGFGTHDEGFEVLTLLQTGKAPPMPVILMELPGENYWESWDQFIRQQMLARDYVHPADLSFYRIMRSPKEAANWIAGYYSTYHSMRQVRNKLVIRLQKDLTDRQVETLNENFKDILKDGEISKTAALQEEAEEVELESKPRIYFNYNHKNAGRLNEMILRINQMGAIS